MSEEFQRFALEFKQNVWTLSDQTLYKSYDVAFKMVGFKNWMLTSYDQFKQWIYGNFLEVGCAGGELLMKVYNTVNSCVGVDVSDYALIHCNKTLPQKVNVRWANVEQYLPFKNNSFDTVLCGHTLEHLRFPTEAFKEMCRVSKDHIIIGIPMQTIKDRWKPTNLHIQFWENIKSFETQMGMNAVESKLLFNDTFALMLFKVNP